MGCGGVLFWRGKPIREDIEHMSARARILVAMLGLLFASSLLSAQEKPLAATPPMGWNSWNKFGCHVSEDLVRQMADAMVKSGMKDAGYQYIVIDDCWQVERDPSGNIVPDPKTFPSGIKTLADYVHSRGLKFGIYSDAGVRLAPSVPAAWAMNIRMRCNTPPGASIT